MKEAMIEKMNAFTNKNEQDIFLQGLIEVRHPKNCKKRMSETDLQTKSKSKVRRIKLNVFEYHIEFNNRQAVCRVAFQSFFGVTKKRVERICSLKSQNRSPFDKRGKSVGSRSRMMSGENCKKIHEFINSIPVKQVHYASILKKYLSADLNVKILYEGFIKQHPECIDIVKYKFFLKYFHENFNLSFGRPQIDVCSKCEELSIKIKDPHLNENAKRAAVAEHIVHKRRASKFFKKVESIRLLCKDNDKIAALCFDYMQNLPLPSLPVQEIFYYRQLWVNEFCIHNFTTEKATFYSYQEGECLKGPNEVCSFLNDYIKENIPNDVKQLHLFCDGCPGQNRNNTVLRFLLALTITKRFEQVSIYFPQRGHSFNDCDRDFATVKRKIRREDRIYTPQQYEDFIVSSSNSRKFNVKHVTHQDVADFKNWWPDYFKKKVLSSRSYGKRVAKEQKVFFAVNNFYEFEFTNLEPGVARAKPFIDGLVDERFCLLKNISRETPKLFIPDPASNPAYQDKIPINEKK